MSSAGSHDDDDEIDCASTTSNSEVRGPSSTNSDRKRKSMSGSVFKAWSFQLTVKSDLGHGSDGTTSEEKGRLLTEHLRTRTGHSQPTSVKSITAFCDKLLFSAPPDSAGFDMFKRDMQSRFPP